MTPVRSFLIQEKSIKSAVLSFNSYQRLLKGLLFKDNTVAANRFYFTTFMIVARVVIALLVVFVRSHTAGDDHVLFSVKCTFICIYHYVLVRWKTDIISNFSHI